MPHVVFILYHKTGFVLSKLLESITRSETDAPKGWSPPSRKCLCSKRLSCESGELDVARWDAPELLLSPAPVPSCYYVVHMVRDPARWALSFYDYHSQTPTPEAWADESQRHPHCGPKSAEFAEALGLREPLLGAAIAACEELTHPGRSYVQHMRMLPESDGLRFTAYMNLWGNNGQVGDMLRSAANAVALRQRGAEARVLTFSMDEMASAPETAFGQLAAIVADAAGRPGDSSAWVQQLADTFAEAEAAEYAKKSKTKCVLRQCHMTSGSSASALARKANLTKILNNDPVLGPIFELWRRVVYPDSPAPRAAPVLAPTLPPPARTQPPPQLPPPPSPSQLPPSPSPPPSPPSPSPPPPPSQSPSPSPLTSSLPSPRPQPSSRAQRPPPPSPSPPSRTPPSPSQPEHAVLFHREPHLAPPAPSSAGVAAALPAAAVAVAASVALSLTLILAAILMLHRGSAVLITRLTSTAPVAGVTRISPAGDSAAGARTPPPRCARRGHARYVSCQKDADGEDPEQDQEPGVACTRNTRRKTERARDEPEEPDRLHSDTYHL